MKKNEVKIGGLYTAKVSDKIVTVRIDSTRGKGGWNATNTATGKRIRIKSAQRLRGQVKSSTKAKASGATKSADRIAEKVPAAEKATTKKVEAPANAATAAKAAATDEKSKKADGDRSASTTRPTGTKPKRIGALDAAVQVLAKAGKPMRAKELIAAMTEQRLWKSPHGKTPHATLYAAMLREITAKGKGARFAKVDRGQFAFNG